MALSSTHHRGWLTGPRSVSRVRGVNPLLEWTLGPIVLAVLAGTLVWWLISMWRGFRGKDWW